MIVFKILGVLLVIGASTGIGYQKAERAEKRVRILKELERLIGRIQGEIFYRETSLDELLAQLKKEKFCSEINLEQCVNLRNCKLPDELIAGERKQLADFFQNLGRVTTQESVKHGMYYQKLCAQFLEKAAKESRMAKELYIKLGLCAGTLLAVILF